MKSRIVKTLAALAFAAVASATSFGEAVEAVAYWNKDFASGSTKNGYTVSLGTGAKVNADGTVSLTQTTKGSSPHGVEINFFDTNGETAFPGSDMTVIVRYSGLTYSTSRNVFFSTIWGDSKDAAELVVSRKGDGKFYYNPNITATSGNPAETAFSSITTAIPTDGLMLITLAGGGRGNGTRVGFAKRNADGSYGDVTGYGYADGATYSNKKFYGIKIGGTVGAVNHFHRPGMKVEAVAIVKGFTATLRTFRYLFPDEAFRFDYAAQNPTSETKFLDGFKVSQITNGVFSAKVMKDSISWVGGMVCACQKAFTPASGAVTKMAIQYQVRESDYDKSADIYYTDKTDGVYFKKTGGHYHGISGDKLGTDDAKWTKSSSAYNFNDFSAYVPFTKTAAVAADTDWTALGWTGDAAPTATDLACLKVTAPATVTVDAAGAAGALKVVSHTAKTTLKYTDAAKLLTSKYYDFSWALGKVALDCSALTVDGEVVLMSGSILGYENIDVAGSSVPEGTKLLVSATAVTLRGAYTAAPVGNVNWSALEWTPAKPEGGFEADAVLKIKNTADATVTIDEDLTAASLSIETAAGASLVLNKNDVTVTVAAYDFMFSQGTTTLGFNPGASPVVAGADTAIAEAGTGAITIGAGKRLTVKGGSLTASKVTNDGTLRFAGGTEQSPISVTGDANLGIVTLAADTYVVNDDKGTTRRYNVTGSGATSFYTIARNGTGAPGMLAGSSFDNVIVVSTAASPATSRLWFERATITETVGLKMTGRMVLSDLTPNPAVVRSLTGGSDLTLHENQGLTVKCMEDADYAGATAIPITIGAGTATQTFSGNYTGALTVNQDGKAALKGAANPSAIVNNGTLDINLDETYRLPGDNAGTINLHDSDLVVMADADHGTINLLGTGKVRDGFFVNINHCGSFTVPDGYDPANVRLYYAGGAPVRDAVISGRTITYFWDIQDGACWWDYEFNGDVTSTGADKTTLTAEGTKPFYDPTTNALWVGHARHYRSVSAYPEAFTAVMYGKIVNQEKQFEIGFGSSAGQNVSVSLACGDPAAEEVQLLVAEGTAVKKTVSMTVPNAYTANHLYAFVCKTVTEGETEKTRVIVYLDGIEWDSYTFGSKVTLGGGFQIGSIHGGILTGYAKATTDNENSFLDFLRTYDVALNAEAMDRYAKMYPYVSANGKATRTFAGGAAAWTADGAWQQELDGKTFATNCPNWNSMIQITAAADATVTFDLDGTNTYEQFTLQGAGAFTLKAGGAMKPTVSGLTTVGTDVMLDWNAIGLGKTIVLADKTLTFDFTGFPLGDVWENVSFEVTGAVTLGEGAAVTAVNIPTAYGRTATFGLNEFGHYALNVTTAENPDIVMTVADDGTTAWTWDGEPISEPDWSKIATATITKRGTGTGFMANKGGYAYTYAIDAGTLKSPANGVGATITVNEGGTFDVNGMFDSPFTVVLNGGSLVNNGSSIALNKQQYVRISQTAASTVGGTGDFGYIVASYKANPLDLGGATLTKEGTNTFTLCNTTVTNGAVVVSGGTLAVHSSRAVTFTADASLTLGAGTTLAVGNILTVGAITANGATINNANTVSAFTLNGTATLAGSGTYGTVTMAEDAVANVGTRRGITFAGAGTVDVELTDAEFEQGKDITVFATAQDATTKIGRVTHGGKTYKVKTEGGKITFIAKAGLMILVR